MPSLLDTSLSGLRAYQGALSTTSQNIANVGNENYTRQRVEFNARLPIKQGSGFVGQGVDLTSVNRVIDSFNTINVRDLTSNTSRLEVFDTFASRIENVIADQDASLLPTLNSFFSSLNDVANDPSANAPRVALVASAESLQQRFLSISGELKDIEDEINSRIRSDITDINAITTELASLNDAITRISDVSNRPSDLLDQRDSLIKKLAEKISVTVVEQQDGSFNVLVGTGQLLVTNSTALTLVAQNDQAQPDKVTVAIQSGSGGIVNISNTVVGGELGGIIDFRDNILNATQNRLGRAAIAVSETMNAQSIKGLDLKGDLGENLFSTVDTGRLQGQFGGDYLANGFDNTSGETVSFDLVFDGVTITPVNVTIAVGDTNEVIGQKILNAIGTAASVAANADGSYTVPGTTTGQSMRFSLFGSNIQFENAGGPSPLGNNLLISNLTDTVGGNDATMTLSSLGSSSTRTTAGVVTNASDASFLGPATVAIPNTNNTGSGSANFSITDVTQLTNSDYELSFNSGNYTLVRLSDNTTLTTATGPFFSFDGLEITVGGTPNNGDSFFIRPTQEGALNFKSLVSDPAKIAAALPVRASRSAANIGNTSVSNTTVTDALNGDVSRTIDIIFDASNPAGTFDVVDRATGNVLQDNVVYFDGINVTQNGWQIQLNGTPQTNDVVTVQKNTNSTSDNRNMLLLAGLQTQGVLDNSTVTFEQTYNALTSEVGVVSQQVAINLEVENSLLQSAFAQRESVSGVNLDEEAADLIRFQQAYQALARIIQASDEIFQSLLASV